MGYEKILSYYLNDQDEIKKKLFTQRSLLTS